MGRFINGDVAEFAVFEQDILSHNLFGYCGNEPVCTFDPFGNEVVYIYGNDQKGSAKINIKLLKKKYKVFSFLVESKSDFQNVWNTYGKKKGKLAKIDIVIINLHGNPYNVEYVNFEKLAVRKIDTLFLLSCNAGHLDYIDTNPATQFYIKNSINKLVCCDGTHYRWDKQTIYWRPTWWNWFKFVKVERVRHYVKGDETFQGYCISPRNSEGFILYKGKRGNKITSYTSIGYSFTRITKLLKKVGKW